MFPSAGVALLLVLLQSVVTDDSAVVRVVPAAAGESRDLVTLAVRSSGDERLIRTALNVPVQVRGNAPVTVEVVEPRTWWSPALTITTPSTVDLPLWHAAELRGTVIVQKGVDPPHRIDATFNVRRGQTTEHLTTVCPVAKDGAWTCRLPESTLDIRLGAAGFAPYYAWDVELSRARVKRLPAFTLKRGSSISGWMSTASRVVPDGALVRLIPMTYGGSADDLTLVAREEKPNRRGFFQFSGIPAGEWFVMAEGPGFSSSNAAEVTIDDGKETVLRDALLLRDLADVQVTIEPPLFAVNRPWRVRLQRRPPGSAYDHTVAESEADENGHWSLSRAAAGDYRLDVLDKRGSVYSSTPVAVEPGMSPVHIRIASTLVKGRVRAGERGIPASLKFFGNRGGGNLSTTSNADGDFTIRLPSDGEWRVNVKLQTKKQELTRTVHVERREDETHAVIDLDLPGGRIAGRVVDESGKPVTASVIVTREGVIADVLAEQGSFELIGIDSGPAMIQAGTEDAHSGAVPISVDDHASPLTLVLRPMRKMEGSLLAPSGSPVAGALVRYWTPNAPFLGEVVTSPTGRFSFELEPNAPAVTLAIVAPGFPAKLTSVLVPDKGNKLEVVLGRAGGRLVIPIRDRTPPWPSIARDGAQAILPYLVPPRPSGGTPPWLTREGYAIDIEPGEYTICATRDLSDACVRQVVVPGATVVVDTPRRPEQAQKGNK